jgi:phosphoribosylformimino-5-aminoimidazole carboxamide ribonucleotide (ProFAR) isomerase
MLELSKIKSSTPLSFGGGLCNKDRVDIARSLSFERLIFSSNLFLEDSKVLDYTISTIGKQAVVGCIPFKFIKDRLMIFNSFKNSFFDFTDINFDQINMCDELLVYDCLNEGKSESFDGKVLENSFFSDKRLIISGGVDINSKIDCHKNIASMLIENRILHKEYSIRR